MLKHLFYFIKGFQEFRYSFTMSVPNSHIETYDKGRDLAHKLTFRYWD